MNLKLNTAKKAVVLAASAALGLGVAASVAPNASATVLDSDRPIVTETHYDFGEHWVLGAPVNGGYLDWDLNNGVTTPKVSGYLYLTDKECGRVQVEYFDEDHNLLDSRHSFSHCAPGNGKTQWWVNLDTYSSMYVTHVHVEVQKKSGSSFITVGTDTEDFD